MQPLDDLAAQAMADLNSEDADTDNKPPTRAVTESQAAQIHNGQVRMAYRLALLHGKELMHVYNIGWFYYDGKRWAEDDRGFARQAVLDTLRQALAESVGLEEEARKILRNDVRKCESNGGIEGVLGIAASLQRFAYTVDDLDPDPYLWNAADCTVDLRTMKTHTHDPADRITKVSRAAFRKDATGTEWEKFLDRVLPNKAVRGYLQRYVGTAVCGRVLEHKLSILTGEGRNGKGVFYGAVNWAMGDYGDAADPELFTHKDNKHPTGQMDLRGRRFVVVSENDKHTKLAEATVKRLTGGDRIKARLMRQDFVEFEPSHTPILVTNHLPKVSGDDPALWARLRVVPFEVVIPEEEQDKQLGEKLILEADAILAWCIEGWKEYRRIGLAEPDEVKAATAKYKADSDACAQFVEEHCHVSPGLQEKVSVLWEAWTKFCKVNGYDAGSQREFGQSLERAGFADHKGGKGVRYRKGLKLHEIEDDSDAPF